MPPEQLDKKLLILNLTEASPCVSTAPRAPAQPCRLAGEGSRGDQRAPSSMGGLVCSLGIGPLPSYRATNYGSDFSKVTQRGLPQARTSSQAFSLPLGLPTVV